MDPGHQHTLAQLSYGLAFMTGILGSGHCVGMCGALVSGFFLKAGEGGRGMLPVAAYHGARIGIYTLIGMLAALAGAVLLQTGILGKAQGLLQIAAGLVVILLGLEILGVLPFSLTMCFAKVSWLRKLLVEAPRRGPVAGAAMGGVVNGLMPCSMTLAMAVSATTAATPVQGGLLLLAFGAGTLPSMLFVSVAFAKLGAKVRGQLLKGAALVVIVLGVATVYQGARYFAVMRNLANW
ncbi:MAG TPA: sulfite exporter TauE/SafE family protein [Burkholderiales bacterium]|nr:sulfite exporter TauE/SafE family protein [Burkholderiales bacterium]